MGRVTQYVRVYGRDGGSHRSVDDDKVEVTLAIYVACQVVRINP